MVCVLFYRYINSLDPKISGQPWTYEEDKRLLQLVQKYGTGAVYRTFFSLLFLVCCILVRCGFHNHVYFGGCVIAVGSLRVANVSQLVGNSLSPCSNGFVGCQKRVACYCIRIYGYWKWVTIGAGGGGVSERGGLHQGGWFASREMGMVSNIKKGGLLVPLG